MQLKNRFLVSILIFTVLSGFAQTQQTYSFSLKEAVEYARKNSYAQQNALLDVLAAQKKVNEITAMGLPQITGSGNIINNTQIPTQVMPNFLKPILGSGPDIIEARFGNTFTSNLTVSANQLVFDGTFFLGLKASKEFVNLSRLNAKRNEIETEVSVSKAYFLVLLLEANQKMMQSNVESLRKTKDELDQMNKNGFVEKLDVDRIELQLSNLIVQMEKIQDQKNIASMLLKFQMGLNVSDSVVLTDNLEKLNANSASLATDNVDLNSRIEYQMLNQQLVLNNLDKKRYQVGYLPSLYAFANHQKNAFASSGNFDKLYNKFYPGTTIGLSISVPIFDGFKKHAQIQQARISIAKTENDIRSIENMVKQQVYAARTSYTRAAQQLDIQKRNYKLAEDIYKKAQIKYSNGVGSNLELTTAQNDLSTARTNMLGGIYDYFVAELELKKALGQIK